MSHRLRVNMIACTGHGMCAELLPEAIEMDRWGYPIVPRSDLPEDQIWHARRAVAACPALALVMERSPE